jgi:hypothetical protein
LAVVVVVVVAATCTFMAAVSLYGKHERLWIKKGVVSDCGTLRTLPQVELESQNNTIKHCKVEAWHVRTCSRKELKQSRIIIF